jgi:hypothetical protein
MNWRLPLLVLHTVCYGSLLLSYANALRALIWSTWTSYWCPTPPRIAPTARYFLGSSYVEVESTTVVPEGSLYIEDWVHDSTKRCVVRYAGETIPQQWSEAPHEKHARSPWIWVGDLNTEVDLTRTFSRFLVVGNRITPELVHAFIRVAPTSNLIYIESGTFKELKFPGEGLTIEEYAD